MKRREILQTLGLAGLSSTMWTAADFSNIIGYRYVPESLERVRGPVRKLTAITLGAGNRGNVYGDYAIEFPEDLDIVGVAEPVEVRRRRYSEKHNIKAENQFLTWEDVFKRPKFADVIIVTTPDNLHYGPAMIALKQGYDLLLEKPIAQSWQECNDILEQKRKCDRVVAVCHVLRYAPYFEKIKQVVDSGHFGRLISLQHFEPVEHVHMSHSYVRGNWRREDETNPMILAKSCHDMDILRWWIGRPCSMISSFGSLTWFTEANAPEGSTKRCTDGCAVERECPYSAIRIYHDRRERNYVFDLPLEPAEQAAAIMDNLRSGPYGRCVYRCDNDVVDHQVCALQFEDDITATFSMEAFTHYAGRRTRIMGSLGDLYGDETDLYIGNFRTREIEHWNLDENVTIQSGHGGGDWRLVRDFLRASSEHDENELTSGLDASMEAHLMAFKAEESRKELKVKKVAMG